MTTWTLCSLSTLLLVSRFGIRLWKTGKFHRSDYFLLLALPSLFVGAALLQTSLDTLYAPELESSKGDVATSVQNASAAVCLTSAIELLWLCIYTIKASILAQFRFHKPPFAYVSIHLTRLYWAVVILSSLAFAFTLAVPIMLCPTPCTPHYQSMPSKLTR